MKILKEYFAKEKEIHDYFGYDEGWGVLPICDSTDYWWCLNGQEVRFGDTKEDVLGDGGYSNEIYNSRMIEKNTYRKPDYTMIAVDTRCDGNQSLQIFDNRKEIHPSELD